MLYLIDSSAVLNDFSFEFKEAHKYITTPLAINEFRDMRSKHLMENALHRGILSIQEPSEKSLRAVEKRVAKEGFSRISKTDISLLALVLDFKQGKRKFKLVTDDYSIQNFAKLLGIPFEAVIRGRIRETISFALKCPACSKTLEKGSKARKCPVCGSVLKRVKTN